MEIQHGSLVDTVIEYASVKFGVELEVEQVAQQLKSMAFSQQVELASIIKREDDDEFAGMIDMSAVNESGGTIAPSAATIRPNNTQATKDANAVRRANNAQTDANRDARNVERTVAGAQKQPTGQANRVGADPDDQQRDQNAQATQQNAQLSQLNAQEIERLKQLAFGKRK
jgi:prolyl-tRNA synthetase